MSRKLIKVAKELNVGLTSIVDYLGSKGFEIENKPNFTVTEDMYNVLLMEFKGSLAVKEKADQIVIGSVRSHSETEDVKKDAAPQADKKRSALEELLKAKKSKKTTEEEHTLEKREDDKVTTIAETIHVIEKKVSVEDEAGKKAEQKEGDNEIDSNGPQKKDESKPEIIPEELNSEEEKDEEIKEDGRGNIPGLKVVGKIDLESHRRPKKTEQKEDKKVTAVSSEKDSPVSTPDEKPLSSEEEIEKSTEDSTEKKDETVVSSEEKRQENVDSGEENMHVTKVPQLKGLKIMGKIDASAMGGKKKKPAEPAPKTEVKKAASPPGGDKLDDTLRKKRKRKKVTVISSKSGEDTLQSGGDRRSGGNFQRGPSTSKPGKKSSEPEKQEVSQKEIEEQIKATMARLSGGGKSKRSKLRRDNREKHREKQEAEESLEDGQIIELTEFITVSELASLLNTNSSQVIMTCMNLGVIVSINQRLDAEIIELIASEFDKEVKFVSAEDQSDLLEEEEPDDPSTLLERAPIVTVMGHVDHGKTSLLDYIREANVAHGEAGGITQHIGAYEVLVGPDQKKITFLDTPGHEAFTAMRARGAKVTDVAIIIIAADDTIMPQTKEAISHAQAAGVPMIFAINKIDKPGADPNRIKQELASMNLLIEEWGGKYQSQDISAKEGLNIDLLLEKILLEAEILDLKANPERGAVGTILEASLDKGRGYVAKALVQNGTLKIGDAMLAGETSGKVKAMFNERGKRVMEAGPATPVLILGLSGAPQAGELFKIMASDSDARAIAAKRSQIMREQANRASKRISLDEIGRRLALGTFKELNLIVKGDMDGSIEALSDSLMKLSIEKVQVNVIHKAVGQIIESDVLLASASDAIIVGFQVRPSSNARQLAEKEGVQIKMYSIIYQAIEEIKLAIEGMLEPTKEEKIIGQLSVREVFKISKVGTIAGCLVDEGKILRNSYVRVIRDGIVVYPTKEGVVGELASLKRYKDDVKEVRAGMECGLNVKNFNDLKVGDVIEGYEINMVKGKAE